ncbi:MAG: CBS domain-containing protein [Actinomycetota bacterium]
MTSTDALELGDRTMFWSSRVLRRGLLDGDGSTIGVVEDILLSPALPAQPPAIRGFVARVDRRRIFVHQARIDAIGRDGVHLRGGTVDLRQFKQRAGEILVAAELVGTPTPDGPVTDVGFTESSVHEGTWVAESVAAGSGRLRRRTVATLPWSAIASRFQGDSVAGDLARLRDMHKADAAAAIRSLSEDRRAELTAALDASRLADVLEELPEEEQVEILGGLETEDAVAVLDEMEVDDEIDLLKELPTADREELLAQMPEDEVQRLRSLLSYHEDTAGGMMTPEAVIVSPGVTVAEAIARLRDADLPPALTMRVFVVEAPTTTPTGRYLGSVTLPRLLKEQPTREVGDCADPEVPTLLTGAAESEVAQLVARYDLLAVAVVDAAQRLVGVVTVDDVMVRLVGEVDQ